MFCILKIGCRCAFEIAKEAERDEIGLAGKQQFAGRARRMAAAHTIRKYKKMAGQNTFQILLLNDANMIGEH